MEASGYRYHNAAAGDTFDSLALAAYDEERMAHILLAANPELNDILIFEGGERVRVPVVEETAGNETLPPWRRGTAEDDGA